MAENSRTARKEAHVTQHARARSTGLLWEEQA